MKTIKITRTLVLGTMFTGFSALANPVASLSFTKGKTGQNLVHLSVLGLSGSATYSLKVDSSTNGSANWYTTKKTNATQFNINVNNGDIQRDLSNTLIQPGQVLMLVTRDSSGNVTHSFGMPIPCSTALTSDFASSTVLQMTEFDPASQYINGVACVAAPVQVQPIQPPAASNGPSSQPQVPVAPGASQAPTAPAQPVGPSLQDINYANNQGQIEGTTFANEVLNTFARMENYRYNFYKGFSQNRNMLGSYDRIGLINKGSQDASAGGTASGTTAGSQLGAANGINAGYSDARNRFESDIDKAGAPDTSVPNLNPPVPSSFDVGTVPGYDQNSRLAQLDAQLKNDLQNSTYTDNNMSVGFGNLTHPLTVSKIAGYSSYQSDLVMSWYNSNWALGLYKQPGFGGGSTGKDTVICQTKPAVCPNFENAFVNAYNSALQQTWSTIVMSDQDQAFQNGMNYAKQLDRDNAYDSGYRSGYTTAFQAAAKTSYVGAFDSNYTSRFDQVVQQYNSMAILEGGDAIITDANGGQNYVLGQPINVVVTGIRNAGTKSATLGVQTVGLAGSRPSAGSITFAGSKTMADARFNGIASISNDPATYIGNQEIDVVIGSNILTYRKMVTINFLTQVNAMGSLHSPFLVEFVRQNLTKEWASSNHNTYDPKNPQNSYAGQLAMAARAMNASDRAFVESQLNNFLQVYGKEPTGLFNHFARDRWLAATALLKQM